MSDHSLEDLLSEVPLLAGLSHRHLRRLVGISREVHHDPGHVVAEQGRGALAFHLVLDGEADVTVSGELRRTLRRGDHFGEISMIDGGPRSATVVARSVLRTLAIPHAAFCQLLDEEPTFARVLLGGLCARIRELEAPA
jgi:CRP-like cAMP-binding protein